MLAIIKHSGLDFWVRLLLMVNRRISHLHVPSISQEKQQSSASIDSVNKQNCGAISEIQLKTRLNQNVEVTLSASN